MACLTLFRYYIRYVTLAQQAVEGGHLFFHQQDTGERITAAKSGAGRETNNSSTDYCEIIHTLPLEASACRQAGLKSNVDRPIL